MQIDVMLQVGARGWGPFGSRTLLQSIIVQVSCCRAFTLRIPLLIAIASGHLVAINDHHGVVVHYSTADVLLLRLRFL